MTKKIEISVSLLDSDAVADLMEIIENHIDDIPDDMAKELAEWHLMYSPEFQCDTLQ